MVYEEHIAEIKLTMEMATNYRRIWLRMGTKAPLPSPGTGEFPAQMASNAENISIWWRHHALFDLNMVTQNNSSAKGWSN